MPVQTRGIKQRSPGRPTTVGYDPTALGAAYKSADQQGAGITPGASPDSSLINAATNNGQGTKFGNPIEQIGHAINWLRTYNPWAKK